MVRINLSTQGWTNSTAVIAVGDVVQFAGVFPVNPQNRLQYGKTLRQFVVLPPGGFVTPANGAAAPGLTYGAATLAAGTFNPVHAGHMAFALQSLKEAKLDMIYFLPERQPRHKQGVEHFAHRVAMLQRAIRPYRRFGVLELTDVNFTPERTKPREQPLSFSSATANMETSASFRKATCVRCTARRRPFPILRPRSVCPAWDISAMGWLGW